MLHHIAYIIRVIFVVNELLYYNVLICIVYVMHSFIALFKWAVLRVELIVALLQHCVNSLCPANN